MNSDRTVRDTCLTCCILAATYFTIDDRISAVDGLLALILFEVEGDTVDAMSLVRGSLVSLSLEDMAKVTTAVGQLNDLRPSEPLTSWRR